MSRSAHKCTKAPNDFAQTISDHFEISIASPCSDLCSSWTAFASFSGAFDPTNLVVPRPAMGKSAMKSMKAKAMKSGGKPMKVVKPSKPTKAMKAMKKSAKADQKDLDTKIEQFLKEASAMQASSSGDVDLQKLPWKKYFDASQMSALWNRLHNKIQTQGSVEAKNAWGQINTLSSREGKGMKKRNVLWLSLKYPDDWANRTVRYVQTVVRTESSTATESPKTRGELNQLHGETEAADLINKGFFEQINIKGVPHFVKVGFKKTLSMSRNTEEQMELQKSVDSQEIKALEDKFVEYKCGLDLEWSTSWGAKASASGGGGSAGDKKALGSINTVFERFSNVALTS